MSPRDSVRVTCVRLNGCIGTLTLYQVVLFFTLLHTESVVPEALEQALDSPPMAQLKCLFGTRVKTKPSWLDRPLHEAASQMSSSVKTSFLKSWPLPWGCVITADEKSLF